MANIDKHPAGSFCWMELGTTDHAGAKKFYTSLFGWSVNEFPLGPGDMYTIFQLKGRDVAAAYTLRKDQRDQGASPHWMLYIGTASADPTATKAKEAGGKVLQPAFDVAENGRMAVLQDPTGGVFSVWQAKQTQGVGIANENNSFCWADLSTPDPERAAKFYSSLFGWQITKAPNDPSGYLHIKNGEHFIGGIPPTTDRDPKTPSHWLAYFMVADVEGTSKSASQLGAKILMQPRKLQGVGTWSVIGDPQGAVFALFKSER